MGTAASNNAVTNPANTPKKGYLEYWDTTQLVDLSYTKFTKVSDINPNSDSTR